MKKKILIASTQIQKLSPKGFGVTSYGNRLALVPGTVPGDVVSIEIGARKKEAYLGRLLEVLQPSCDRVAKIRCLHVGRCGGCSLQQMDYVAQLRHKQQQIEDLFQGLFDGQVAPIVPADPIWHYRNKMEYTFSQDAEGHRFLGLIVAGSKGKVETLSECHIAPIWFLEALKGVQQWWEDSGLLAFHAAKNRGSLRTVTMREGRNTQDKMVILTVSGVPEFAIKRECLQKFVEVLQAILGQEKLSLFLRVQQAVVGQETQFFEMQLAGPAHIREELVIQVGEYQRTLQFAISPTAFFQPNTVQAEKIYSKALKMVGQKQRRCILDLYAGTATFGLVFAPFASKVIAIELNPYAVFDAEMNRELNGVANLDIHRGDVAEVLKLRKQEVKGADLVLLDPPRTGLSEEALALVLSLAPEEILYVSCAPKTQVRDLAFLQAQYQIVMVQPIDQFPHTVHVENLVLLRKKVS